SPTVSTTITLIIVNWPRVRTRPVGGGGGLASGGAGGVIDRCREDDGFGGLATAAGLAPPEYGSSSASKSLCSKRSGFAAVGSSGTAVGCSGGSGDGAVVPSFGSGT